MATFIPASPVRAILPPNTQIAFVDVKTGIMSIPANNQQQQLWSAIAGAVAAVVCATSGTNNAIVLTASSIDSGRLSYFDFATFRFVAAGTSTGSVTARVGTMTSLKVYKSNGATQAGSGDIVANSLYDLIYASHLDSAAGGFVLK